MCTPCNEKGSKKPITFSLRSHTLPSGEQAEHYHAHWGGGCRSSHEILQAFYAVHPYGAPVLYLSKRPGSDGCERTSVGIVPLGKTLDELYADPGRVVRTAVLWGATDVLLACFFQRCPFMTVEESDRKGLGAIRARCLAAGLAYDTARWLWPGMEYYMGFIYAEGELSYEQPKKPAELLRDESAALLARLTRRRTGRPSEADAERAGELLKLAEGMRAKEVDELIDDYAREVAPRLLMLQALAEERMSRKRGGARKPKAAKVGGAA